MKAVRFGQNVSATVKYYSTKSLPAPITNPKLPNNKLFINNEWVESLKPGNFITAINPTTGKVITEIQSGCKEDVDRAVEAAKKAFLPNSPWRKMDASARSQLLHKLSNLIERDAVYLASLETLDVGKVYSATLAGELAFVINGIRHVAGWADKIYGQVLPIDGEFMCYTRNEPVGVCGLISAWNFSLLMNSTKLALALTAGNVIILKPSQHASLPVLHLAELVKEAGFPPGVVSLIPGSSEVGQIITDHPEIDLISFTGSTGAGQDVYKRGADNMKRLILELGGKSPLVVFDDADMDLAVQTAHTAIFHNAGQCCCAGSRTYVQETIYEDFLKRSIELTKKRKIGNPFDLTTLHGPQANEKQLDIVMEMVESGKKEGATVVLGGNRCKGEGFYMEPTILTNVGDEFTITKEEIFGPVQQIYPFKTMDEVIEKANNTKYGLASSIFSNDVNKINTFSQCIKAGSVWVNSYFGITLHAPFGGYKMSGIAREGGFNSVKAFTEEKCVHVKTPMKVS